MVPNVSNRQRVRGLLVNAVLRLSTYRFELRKADEGSSPATERRRQLSWIVAASLSLRLGHPRRLKPAAAEGLSMPGVPVVAAVAPVVVRPGVRDLNLADALDVLDPVLERRDQPQGRTVLRRQRPAVHFVAQECL